ncbi:hypothetical protein GCM10009555_052520 [Acrocarpospora macrocephala]|uniref:Uncharacterized protein n=1 Tax=Acrocarpospora macrocephala TaxID=150177 RepID=A0A5M3XD14_9ACTN|nr:hypothetical protein Amac_095560 [Acrocarpospora macrocephala]
MADWAATPRSAVLTVGRLVGFLGNHRPDTVPALRARAVKVFHDHGAREYDEFTGGPAAEAAAR